MPETKLINLISMHIENFKGIKTLDIEFTDKTLIQGRNASGKTTIADAFSWLLFGKDSQGRADFQIRPVDKDGKTVDNIEISVGAVLEISHQGETRRVTFKKIQKQNWVKKRGSDAPTFQGNTNSCEIDGFPASQKEYEAKVASLIEEDLFKLMTDPRAFASMKWQDQRNILLRFVSDITDQDVLDTDPERYAPIAEDVTTAGADKAKEKALGILKKLKADQKAYPVRIDEASRGIHTGLDESEMVQKKSELEKKLIEIRSRRDDLAVRLEAMNEMQSKITNIKHEMLVLEQEANHELQKKRYAAQEVVDRNHLEIQTITNKYTRITQAVKMTKELIEADEAKIKRLSDQYKDEKIKQIQPNRLACPTCGREYDAGRVEEITASFEETKRQTLERIAIEGKALRETVNQAREDLKKTENEAGHLQHEYQKKKELQTSLEEELEAIKDAKGVDMAENAMYLSYQKQIEALEEQMTVMDDGGAYKRLLNQEEEDVNAEITALNIKIASAKASKQAEKRVKELKEEQMDCAQKVADQERIVYLTEEFTKAKMDMLSGKINSNFKTVHFRLFTEQINGGIKEACVMQIASNGNYVDYANANHAAQITGGLDVIEALSRLYGVEAPVFLDNGEALDAYNVPKIGAQLIMLNVSNDPELVVSELSD
jgi:DNA repair exonuclease SbcCD ATPase subunit